MSGSEPNGDAGGTDSDTGTTRIEYSDFYELLGVEKDTDPEEVERRARKLLARFHPDKSDHKNADEIYKTLNRAQNILTDPEQRRAYNKLGHDEYLKRREKDGEVSVRDSVTDTDFEPGDNTGTSDDRSNAAMQTDVGTTARNERNTWAGENTENEGYTSITDLDLDASPEDTVWKFFGELWGARVLTGILSIAVMLYAVITNHAGITNTLQSLPGFSYGLAGNAVLFGVMLTGVVTLLSTGAGHWLLRSIEGDIDLKSTIDETRQERKENVSRGYNTDTSDLRGNSQQTSEWDVTSKYDSLEDKRVARAGDEWDNWMYRRGKQLLCVTILLLAGGAVTPGVHPLEYLYMLLSGNGLDTPLWWSFSSGNGYAIAVLTNAVYSVMLAFTAFLTILSVPYGISKEVWFRHYFTESRYFPFLWDTVVTGALTAIVFGGVFGLREVPGVQSGALPEFVVKYLGASDGFTTLSFGVAGIVVLFAVVMLLKARVVLGSSH